MTASEGLKVLLEASLVQRNCLAVFQKAMRGVAVDWMEASLDATRYRALLPEAEVVIAPRFGEAELGLAERLRWVHLTAAGYETVPVEALRERGVVVTNTRSANAGIMAEHVMLCMLMFRHQLPLLMRQQGQAYWKMPPGHPARDSQPEDPPSQVHEELCGATLGIVGLGAVGRECARLARAFGMRVLAFRREVSGTEEESLDGVFGLSDLKERVGACDFVALCCGVGEETRRIANAELFEAMGAGAVIVNIGRGALLDEAALIAALEAGAIAGAALDVFDEEPLPPESPFWRMPNVIVTPHCAGRTPYYAERSAGQFRANLERMLAGRALENVIGG